MPGVEVEAICKAARSVSGDYYDFIQLTPTHIAVAIADISGKGISAALLMASLQAALRSQLLMEGSENLGTAELVSRLNKHLVRNTGDDRFATFFIAVYDSATRQLRYTNAGHLPSFLISGKNTEHLDKGGMVLGVVRGIALRRKSAAQCLTMLCWLDTVTGWWNRKMCMAKTSEYGGCRRPRCRCKFAAEQGCRIADDRRGRMGGQRGTSR